jgi:hypothetical protein
MKARIFYQDCTLFHFAKSDADLKVYSPNILIREYDDATLAQYSIDVGLYTTIREPRGIKEWMANNIFHLMNHLDIPPTHSERPIFEKAGHTSMSIGDFIEFEDGEIWIVAPVGWKVVSS